MKPRLIMLAVVSLAAPVAPAAAQATIDFEAQTPVNAPTCIDPDSAAQTVTIGAATFSGGQLVRATDCVDPSQGGDVTAAYTTFGYGNILQPPNPLTNPLAISFSAPVSGFSFELVNNAGGNFEITTNLGTIYDFNNLGDYANLYISLPDFGISGVTIGQTVDNTLGQPYSFALDNVSYAPEPATWAMMIGGLGMTGAALRRRRTAARLRVA